ncbi:MAG: DUF1328 domain-containing protein [Cyanobacteriota bacterium]
MTINPLWWAVILLIIAVIIGAIGLTGIEWGGASIGRWLGGIFLTISVVLFVLLAIGIVAV